MPKLVTSDKPNKKMRWDAKRKCFVGWQIDVYVSQGAGKRPRRHRVTYSSETEAKSAERLLRAKNENIKRGIETTKPAAEIKIADLLDKKIETFTKRKERIAAKRIFQYFIDLVDAEYVSELRAAHFHQFIKSRFADGLKAQSVRRELSPLSSALRSAGELFPELEDWTPRPVPRPSAKNGRRERIITEAEKNAIVNFLTREKLKDETDAEMKNRTRIGRMFEFAWLTGLRLDEIQKLKKSDYKPKERTLRVKRHKTGNTTNYDFLSDELLDLLNEAVKASETDFIFTISGSPPQRFYAHLRAACKNAKIPFGTNTENGITFHDTRHSFITRLVQVTDLATAKSYSGHTDKELVAYYSHATDESRKAAMERLHGKDEKDLREVFEKVKSGAMDFDEFSAYFRAR